MTTIAYHNNIIAVDSYTTASETITNTDANKIDKVGKVVFIMNGVVADKGELIAAYFGERYSNKSRVSGFIVDAGRVYLAGIDNDDGFWKQDITGKDYAIGSGDTHAWTALDLGCNAVEAVRMAAKRNIYTGGKIRTYKVKS